MLADFLIDFVRDSLISNANLVRNKIVLLVLGLLTLIASLSLLFYFHSLPLISVENYHSKEINYSQVYYDNQKEYPKIVLISGEQTYNINYPIWRNHYSPETIADELAKFNRAKIWLDSPDSHGINGIVTPTFSIDPVRGIEWDKENRKWGVILAWIFFACGGVLMIIPFFFLSKP
jgi:hypothetical protein